MNKKSIILFYFIFQVTYAGIFDKILQSRFTFLRRGSSDLPSNLSKDDLGTNNDWLREILDFNESNGKCYCECSKDKATSKKSKKDFSIMAITIPKYKFVDIPLVREIPSISLGKVKETMVNFKLHI